MIRILRKFHHFWPLRNMSAGRHVLCMEISLRLWTNHMAPVLNFSNRRTRLRLLNLSASHLFTRSRSAGFLKKNSIRDNPLLLTSRPKMFTKSKLADARSRKKKPSAIFTKWQRSELSKTKTVRTRKLPISVTAKMQTIDVLRLLFNARVCALGQKT